MIFCRLSVLRLKLLVAFATILLAANPMRTLGNDFNTWYNNRFFLGGSLGLSIGYNAQVDIVPVAGVWIFPQWSLGVSGRYSYYSHSSYQQVNLSQPLRNHIWGYSFFTQVLPIPDISEVTNISIKGGLFLHGEHERLYIDSRVFNPLSGSQGGKTWVNLSLLGVGYRHRVGEKAAINLMLLWEVSKSSFSPYPKNPMLRLNFTVNI